MCWFHGGYHGDIPPQVCDRIVIWLFAIAVVAVVVGLVYVTVKASGQRLAHLLLYLSYPVLPSSAVKLLTLPRSLNAALRGHVIV